MLNTPINVRFWGQSGHPYLSMGYASAIDGSLAKLYPAHNLRHGKAVFRSSLIFFTTVRGGLGSIVRVSPCHRALEMVSPVPRSLAGLLKTQRGIFAKGPACWVGTAGIAAIRMKVFCPTSETRARN